MEAKFGRALNFMPKECVPMAMEYLKQFKIFFGEDAMPKEMNGYRLLPGFEPDSAKVAYDQMEINESDILIASYPKTGTTWVVSIVHQILYGDNPADLEKYSALQFCFHYLEFGAVCKYEVFKKISFPRQVFATHLPEPLVNMKKFKANGAKLIYVIRNPKDQAVSWRHFAKGFAFAKSEFWKPLLPEDEKEFYDVYLAGNQYAFAKKGEGYLECIKEWYKHKNDENVLFLVYEEMKKNPHNEIKKIADFIGKPLSDEQLNNVVEKTSFASMKKESEKTAPDNNEGAQFFRKGQIGDWKNHLTVAQSELIDRKVKEILGDTDIQFIYE
uniref:Sulfotransferase n=1 Tax=Phallusia mammillata TaxID=59560 RepID=A0A6F9DUK9_9ASCI|nr:sulfotransferase 1C2-like [Phallusia mammillata]